MRRPISLQNLRVKVVQAEFERDRRAFLPRFLVGFVLDLLYDFFDSSRVDTAVGNQLLDCLLGDFAAVRIEPRKDDRARRVVDDQIDAGGQFECADIAPLASDDPSLEIVAWQVDHGHRGFDGVLGSAALDGFGDVLFGLVGRSLAGFRIEPLEQVGGVVPGIVLDLLEQELLGFVGRQARHAFELVLLAGDQLLVFARGGLRLLLALGDPLLAALQFLFDALEGELAFGELRLASDEALFERLRLLSLLARLPFGAGEDLVRLLLGVKEGFLTAGVGVAFGVLDDAEGLLLGATDRFGSDALAVGDPYREHRAGGDEREYDADEITGYRQHA